MKQISIILIGLFLVLSIIPIVYAQPHEKDIELDLKIPFEVNGTLPSANAWCNVSINYPNSSYLKSNASTTNLNNGEFNVTLLSTEVNAIGEYEWTAYCCNDGTKDECAAGYGSFEVTPTGRERLNSGESLSLFASVFIIIIVAAFFFFLSFVFKSNTGKIICIGFAAIMLFITVLYSLTILNENFGGFSSLTENYAVFFMVVKVISSVVLTFFVLYCFLLAFKLWKIKRGLFDDDD